MSGTVCCYAGCKRSYSTDKDISFFKFPDDPKRRKKWMQNSGNVALENLPERQLRGKRICSDHFTEKSFQRPESKTALNDSAVPIVAKPGKPEPPPSPAAGRLSKGKVEKKESTKSEPTAEINVNANTDNVLAVKTSVPVAPTKDEKETPQKSVTRKSAAKEKVQSETASAASTSTGGDEGTTSANDMSAEGVPEKDAEVSLKRKKKVKPMDPKRRKKLKQNSGNPKLENLSARRLRGKRILPGKATTPRSSPQRQELKSTSRESTVPIVSTPEEPMKSPVTTPAGRVSKLKSGKTAMAQSDSAPAQKPPVTPSKDGKESPSKPVTAKEKGEIETSSAAGGESTTSENLTPSGVASKSTEVPLKKKKKVKLNDSKGPQKSVQTSGNLKSANLSERRLLRGKRIESVKSTSAAKSSPKKSESKAPPSEPARPDEDVNSKSGELTIPVLIAETQQKVKKKDFKQSKIPELVAQENSTPNTSSVSTEKPSVSPSKNEKGSPKKSLSPTMIAKYISEITSAPIADNSTTTVTTSVNAALSAEAMEKDSGVLVKKKKKKKVKPQGAPQQSTETPTLQTVVPVNIAKVLKKRKGDVATGPNNDPETAAIIANQVSQMQSVLLPSTNTKQRSAPSKLFKPVVEKVEINENVSEADSYDEYMYFDRDFEEACYDEDADGRLDREFERFYASLKKFLHLSGKWTMGGVQWDPQGRRKVIVISEPDIPPNGRPCVKRCLQFFEDKAIRVFIDGMDMTDVFGMSCYAEKEDVAALICRVAEASSCCGVPEMVLDDLVHFPFVRKRNTSYFDCDCPGVIPNDSYDPMCSYCKQLQETVMENRKKEKQRLMERRIRSQEKDFRHPFGKALYSLFDDLSDETDPTKPKKKRSKETFFRKYLHDTRYKMDGDTEKTERVYIEKPISVDSVSASFQDIVSKLGFNMPNAKKPRTYGSALSRPPSMSLTSTPKPHRMTPGSSGRQIERKTLQVEHSQSLPFSAGASFTFDDGQEYEVIGEEIVEMKPMPSQQEYEIMEVDDETLAKLASGSNPVVMLPGGSAASSNLQVTRIDANDPNLTQILKAINTSHSYKVN